MTDQIPLQLYRVTDANGDIVPGAKVYYYRAGTMTLADIYTDSEASTPSENPVIANAAGVIAQVFFNGGYEVKQVIEDASGATIETIDLATRNSSAFSAADGVTVVPVAGLSSTNVQDAIEEVYAAVTEQENPVFTGEVTTPKIRLTSTTSATVSSTEHAWQVGPDSGENIIADPDGFQARDNGALGPLRLNPSGGVVSIGSIGATARALGAFAVDGNATLSGTIDVTGVATFADTLDVTGVTTLAAVTTSGQLTIPGGSAANPAVKIGASDTGFFATSGGSLRASLSGVFEGQFDAGNISGNDKTVITREKLPKMFLYTAATTLFEGDTTSGSNLVLANTQTESEGPPVVPSGTWMSLGYCPQNRITNFVRVS